MIRFRAGQRRRRRSGPDGDRAVLADSHLRVLRTADRSCCCSARPRVIAVMPPVPGREQATELLFCAHHYRESRQQLAATGAVVFDIYGRPLAATNRRQTAMAGH